MNTEQRVRIKDFLRNKNDHANNPSVIGNVQAFNDDDFADDACELDGIGNEIHVNFMDVEAVVIEEIKDTKGRISDILEAIENELGISVIPFEMANVAPEIIRLQRHDIFVLGDRHFAMSKRVREGVIARYVDRISKTLASGLPFVESLALTVTYHDKAYQTFALSELEWTILMSKFRKYKQKLAVNAKGDLVLEILAERVETAR